MYLHQPNHTPIKYAVITITGVAADVFLQGQFTSDITQLTSHDFQLTAYCNPQGRIWCIAPLWREADHFALIVPREIAAIIVEDLRKYAIFSKVTVTIDESRSVWAWHKAHHGLTPGSQRDQLLVINDDHVLLIATEEQAKAQSEKLSAQQFTLISDNEWELSEIRHHIPNVWKNTVGKLLPHDVDLPELNAVCFTKGCYKGQEIIAKMQYRGQRKKHLYFATVSATVAPQPGDAITCEEQSVGSVVSVAQNTQGEYEVLAVLLDEAIGQILLLNQNRLSPPRWGG